MQHCQNTGIGNPTEVKGIVILPDEWTKPSSVTQWKPATSDDHWTDNYYDLAKWRDMELSGAVFLPAAGRRKANVLGTQNTEYDGGNHAHQDYGVYWTAFSLHDMSESLGFGYDVVGDNVNGVYETAPDYGHAVRLIHRLSAGSSTGGSGSKFFPKKN